MVSSRASNLRARLSSVVDPARSSGFADTHSARYPAVGTAFLHGKIPAPASRHNAEDEP
jgi:hypothetical protein